MTTLVDRQSGAISLSEPQRASCCAVCVGWYESLIAGCCRKSVWTRMHVPGCLAEYGCASRTKQRGAQQHPHKCSEFPCHFIFSMLWTLPLSGSVVMACDRWAAGYAVGPSAKLKVRRSSMSLATGWRCVASLHSAVSRLPTSAGHPSNLSVPTLWMQVQDRDARTTQQALGVAGLQATKLACLPISMLRARACFQLGT